MGLPFALSFAAVMAGLATWASSHRRRSRAAVDPATFRNMAAAADPEFVPQLAEATQMAFTDDNDVVVIRNSDGIIERLFEDMAHAQRSITLQVYFARPGLVAKEFAELVTARARAGVQVRLLFDAIGCRGFDERHFDEMRTAGVQVHHIRPIRWHAPHEITYRAHSRIAVIDGQIGYTGGFGIADAWRDGPQRWQDTSVRFTGSAVSHAQAAFASAWEEVTGTILRGPAIYAPPIPSKSKHTAAFLRTSPRADSFGAKPLMAYAISAARRSIYASTGYFAPSNDLLELLTKAVQRGVDVRVLAAGEATDIRIVRWAGRSLYERLLEQGIRIYEYLPSMLHAKSLVVDGIVASIGAINFDRRSLEVNDETTLVIYDRNLGHSLDDIFHQDLRDAREIELSTFRGRKWKERALEYVAAPLRQQL